MARLEKEGYPRIAGPEAVIDMLEDRMSVQYALAQLLDLIVLRLSEEDALRYEHRAGEQIRGEVQAWIQINQMVTKLGSDYLKIGLDERKVPSPKRRPGFSWVLSRLSLTGLNLTTASGSLPP